MAAAALDALLPSDIAGRLKVDGVINDRNELTSANSLAPEALLLLSEPLTCSSGKPIWRSVVASSGRPGEGSEMAIVALPVQVEIDPKSMYSHARGARQGKTTVSRM